MTTLSKAVQLFLGEYETRQPTRKSYFYDLNAMLKFVGGDRQVEELKPVLMLEYVQHLRRRLQAGEGITSPVTFNKHIKTLKAFFNWCVAIELMTTSPVSRIMMENVHNGVDPEKVMPPETYENLKRAALYQKKKRILALLVFLGDTACRIGGAAALRWDEVDLDRRTAITHQKGKPPLTVDFGTDCRRALRDWSSQQAVRRRDDYVFSGNGRRMTNDSLGQFFSRFCDSVVGKAWGPHSVRHLWAFRAIDANIPIVEVAAGLGDTVEVTLQNYGHYRQENVRKNFLRLASSNLYGPITNLDNVQTG